MEVTPRKPTRSRSLESSIAGSLRGVVTIMAFTDSGWKGKFRLSKRVILLALVVLTALILGSALTVLNLVQGQYYRTRLQYLERENRAMTSLLEGQAEQLGKLKLEMARLKEFEESLRQVSGLSVRSDTREKEADTGEGGRISPRRRP